MSAEFILTGSNLGVAPELPSKCSTLKEVAGFSWDARTALASLWRTSILNRMDSGNDQERRGCPLPRRDCYEVLDSVNDILIHHWGEVRNQEGITWDVVIPLYCAIQDSANALRQLARNGHVRDSFCIARCILETSLNATYILSAGKNAAERAYRHYMQKSLREIDRDIDFMSTYLDASPAHPDWHRSPELGDALEEFTDSRGREKKNWATDSYSERIAAIGREFGKKEAEILRVAMHSIYRPASEILHGTFYGAMFAAGKAKTPERFQDHADFVNWLGDQLSMVLLMSSAAISVMLTAIATLIGSSAMAAKARASLLESAKSFSADAKKS